MCGVFVCGFIPSRAIRFTICLRRSSYISLLCSVVNCICPFLTISIATCAITVVLKASLRESSLAFSPFLTSLYTSGNARSFSISMFPFLMRSIASGSTRISK
ncbi:hypothetical protein [Thermoplasma acidophilum]|uniref:Uncharacterized protein n=1 Tax=Thermoplasma acidophilum (strain ATCC 25905 / DSM 1728 / JCM 9062 / NBRC 15155 / AMRC-C165) TaxID=273075 RepID=Q9HIP4_THEAC|nr:hypothetical protein [Thermoplasma acidophilum]